MTKIEELVYGVPYFLSVEQSIQGVKDKVGLGRLHDIDPFPLETGPFGEPDDFREQTGKSHSLLWQRVYHSPSFRSDPDPDFRWGEGAIQVVFKQTPLTQSKMSLWESVGQSLLWIEICSASTNDEVLDILRQRNLNRYVDDYHSYLEIRDRISDGNEKSGFILQSLQSWARFVIDFLEKENLPYARIRSDRDGCAQLEWRLSEGDDKYDPDNEYYGKGRGIVDITFYPSYLNSLSILSGPYGNGKRRISFSGRLPYSKTIEIIRSFGRRLQGV